MKVKFVPQNIECEIKPGESVLHVAHDNGIYVKSVCRGVPSCAECRVRVIEGDHNVTPPASAELGLIGTGHFIDHRRLSCQLRCFGDITVDMTEQIEKEKKIKLGLDKARPNNREESIGQSGMYGSILAQTVSAVGEAEIESELEREEQEIKQRERSQRQQGGPRGQENQNRNRSQKQRPQKGQQSSQRGNQQRPPQGPPSAQAQTGRSDKPGRDHRNKN